MLFTLFKKLDYSSFSPALLEAEASFAVSPSLCALSCRRAMELAVKFIYSIENLPAPYSDDLNALISSPDFKALLPNGFMPRIDYIRRLGNQAAHTGKGIARADAVLAMRHLFEFADWIDYSYSTDYREKRFDEALLPQPDGAKARELEDKLRGAAESLEQMRRANAALQQSLEQARAQRERPAYVAEDISEYETRRRYIDLDLKEAGWTFGDNCLTEVPVRGMPFGTGEGFADYVLYGANGKPLAVVEAKRTSKDARVGQQQAKLYADCLEAMSGQRPVIFYTNGFETWLWDDTAYPPRRVYGFYSPEDLKWLLDRRRERLSLKTLDIKPEITNRYYQKEAIRAVCDTLMKKQRRALLVMATGTGKTRTVISLVDILARYGWVKNVLFLADRTALVRQAKKHFKLHLPQMSLCSLQERRPDESPDARVVFSTYQTMLGAIDNERRADDGKLFTVGHFDLVIVDEAHRSIYNKFGAIFSYFDALLVGLTATPRGEVDRDTYRIFELETGVPTYAYELDQAIADKFLVPYKTTESTMKFIDQGIRYDELSAEEQREYEEKFGDPDMPENLPPWIDPGALNTWLFNEDTVDRVLQDLVRKGIRVEGGDKLGKTIVFARSHKHAEFIVERFNKLFPEMGGGFARVIDNTVNYALSLIDDFGSPEKMPQVAVSVDMLDTGIDVLEVVNLVFFKKVFSKTKFWQMVGRGTRLCEDLFGPGQHKTHFLCFDYCGNFEFFRAKKDGEEGAVATSLSERAFRLRVDIALELQALKWQEGEYPTCRQAVVTGLASDVARLNRESFLVRQKLGWVEKYGEVTAWQTLGEAESVDVKNELAPILPPTPDDETARRFDILMYRMELKHLRGISYSAEQKNLLAIAEALARLGTIPQVRMQQDLLEALPTPAFWDGVTLALMEQVRQALRGLIQFLQGGSVGRTVYSDFSDVVLETKDTEYEARGTQYANYRRKVETYVRQNQDHIAIHKLRTNKPLTDEDIKALEAILWGEVGTRSDYELEFGEKPMGQLVRELTGLDQQAANEAFSQFLADYDLSQEQMVFVKTIVDFVVHNGILELKRLQDEPFRSAGSILAFPTATGIKLVDTIKEINRNAGLA